MPWSPRRTLTLADSPGILISPSVVGNGRRTQVTASTATIPKTTTRRAATATAMRRARRARDTLRDYPHHTEGKDVTGRARCDPAPWAPVVRRVHHVRRVHPPRPHPGAADRFARAARLGGRGPPLA